MTSTVAGEGTVGILKRQTPWYYISYSTLWARLCKKVTNDNSLKQASRDY
jgi:hypothetical protein